MFNKNSNNFPPNIEPQTYAFIAVLIGSACCGSLTANEQSSFGNWLILVGQFLITSGAQQQLIESRNININYNQVNDIDFLLKAINNLYQELEKLKKKT